MCYLTPSVGAHKLGYNQWISEVIVEGGGDLWSTYMEIIYQDGLGTCSKVYFCTMLCLDDVFNGLSHQESSLFKKET